MNSKRTKKLPKWEEMTKEQIREAVKKKRECDSKAQRVVETLLERIIEEQYFLQCLPVISQCHYDDVVEERVILKLCGYPVCRNDLPVKIPKQKYKISNKSNQVYDLTHRKNFCSNYCYRASTHIKNQMLTSPLWFRDYDDIPLFELLPADIIGIPGDAVDLSLIERLRASKFKNEQFASVSDFTQASLCDMDQDIKVEAEENNIINHKDTLERCNNNSINVNMKENVKEQMEDSANVNTNTLSINEVDTKLGNDCTPVIKQTAKPKHSNPLNIIGDIVEKRSKQSITCPTSSNRQPVKKSKNKKIGYTVPIIYVEKCISEWFNLETLFFLFGEIKVKEMVSNKGDCIKEYLNNTVNNLYCNATSYDNYQALCRKLKLLELEDTRYDKELLRSNPTKPLMDYKSLKEASKEMDLKVKAYFAGETEMVEEVAGPSTVKNNEELQTTNLPLVDKTSQNALRRKIVLTALNKVLPDLVQSLELSSWDASSDVRLLINTFNLKANNILFKREQWYLIGIIMIKLLSLREERLAMLLDKPTADKHMQLLLFSYGQDRGYLDRLVMWLTDIDRLINTNDTSLTIS